MATIEESLIQDAAAAAESVYAISVGDGFNGMLDSRFDEDWIRVELVAGKSYDIRLQGVGLDAVADTVLKIFNSEGEEVAFNDDIETESLNLFSMVEFSPDTTGAYRGNPTQDNSGRYQVAVYDADADYSLILTGTRYSDYLHTRLTGSIGDDELDGREGDDWLDGGPGADLLRGGEGNNTASYVFSREGVEVRLHNGTARGGEAEGDIFAGTEVVEYTDFEGNTLTREVPDIEHVPGLHSR